MNKLTDQMMAIDIEEFSEPIETVEYNAYVECDRCGDLLRESNAYGLNDTYTYCVYCLEEEVEEIDNE